MSESRSPISVPAPVLLLILINSSLKVIPKISATAGDIEKIYIVLDMEVLKKVIALVRYDKKKGNDGEISTSMFGRKYTKDIEAS